MICVSESEFAIIHSILQKHAADCEVRAFGSRYAWTSRDSSDLDLAFVGSAKLGVSRLGILREAFEESPLPFRVDVLDWHTMTKEFQAIISKGYEVIYSPKKNKKENWQKVRLGDAPLEIIDGDRGKNYPAQSDFFEDEYCLFLSTKNVRPEGFDFSTCQFITEEHDKLLRKGKLKRNDLILTTRGTIGNIAFYDDSTPFENVRINSGMVIIRPDKTKLFPKFNYYLFKKLQDDFSVFTTGSAQPQLPIKDLIKLSVAIPSLPTQRAIAATLSCLDDKIELNRRINANLEAQVQAIFKSWFVDFEPFKNGDFVDSKLGCIPKGWRVGVIGEVITLQRGHDLPKEKTVFGKYPVLGSTGIIAYHNSYTTKAPCIVLGRSGNIGNPRYYNFDCWAHNTSIYIKKYKCHPLWVFYILKQLDYSIYKGGSAVPTLNRNHVESHQIIIPPDEIQMKFQKQILPQMNILDNNDKQNSTLAAIRDALLPRLMSGVIEVSV